MAHPRNSSRNRLKRRLPKLVGGLSGRIDLKTCRSGAPVPDQQATAWLAQGYASNVTWVDDQSFLASERAALVSFLDAQREGLIRKVEGVDDAEARMAPTASTLSLLGLVKHAATWERRWFGVVMAGRAAPDKWPEVRTEPRDADLFVDETDTVNCWVASYREAIAESCAIVAAMDLDGPCARPDIIECNVRYVLFHMIEETARHAGHADIIRETLDGTRGY